MWAILRVRNFVLLWSGGFVSALGNWMLFVALPVYVYQRTNSTLATGAMFMARFLPSLLLGSLAGVLVDRWDRRRTLILANLLLAGAIAPLLLLGAAGSLWVVYVAALGESTIALFLVAESALLPTLVDERLLLSANSLNAVSLNVARLTGPALAGLIVGTFGLPAVVLIDMASYTLAAAMTALVRVTPVRRCPGELAQPDVGSPLGRTWREWRDGLRLVQSDRLLSGIFVVWGLAAVAEGTFEVLSVPWVKQSLHGGALQFGWLMSAQAIGGVMGGLLTGWAGRRLGPVALIGISLLSIGAADLAIWNVPMLPFDLVVIALVGLPAIGFTAGTTTLLQSSVADHFRGRVSGALGTTWAALILLGMGAAAIFGGPIGVVTVLNAAGVLSLLTGVLVFVLLGSVRSNGEPVQEREVSA